ncbi:MAG: GGDEF domain-containing protein [Rhodospirillales bacterium]|nr:GGDEF domain-containing protein [Rhodospirillales bacterium]
MENGEMAEKIKALANKSALLSSLWSKDFAIKSLTEAYIVALCIIAIFSIQSHFLTSHLTKQQKVATEVSYMVARERSLIQQIVLSATNLYLTGAELDKQFLQGAVSEFETLHKSLTETIEKKYKKKRRVGHQLYQVYFEVPYSVNDHILALIEKASEFATIDARRVELRKKSLDFFLKELTGTTMSGIDYALESYQEDTIREAERYARWQFWNVMFILTVLLMEALFIFRPLVSRTIRYQKNLQRQAFSDPLTGLNNRRAFMQRADGLLDQAQRESKAVSVMLTDLDFFKKVNDTYGHHAGDQVLKHFSGLLEHSIRGGDIAGRLGGEEFAAVLYNMSDSDAFKIIDRFREKVAQTPCEYIDEHGAQKSLSYTASFGVVSVIVRSAFDVEGLLRKADEALYEAKEKGRNRVIVTVLDDGHGEIVEDKPAKAV